MWSAHQVRCADDREDESGVGLAEEARGDGQSAQVHVHDHEAEAVEQVVEAQRHERNRLHDRHVLTHLGQITRCGHGNIAFCEHGDDAMRPVESIPFFVFSKFDEVYVLRGEEDDNKIRLGIWSYHKITFLFTYSAKG